MPSRGGHAEVDIELGNGTNDQCAFVPNLSLSKFSK